VTGVVIAARPEASARLSLTMHELATNAVKYGALSRSVGQVNVTTTIENGTLVLAWHETGGPIVDPKPVRRGFGTRLLASSLCRGRASGWSLNHRRVARFRGAWRMDIEVDLIRTAGSVQGPITLGLKSRGGNLGSRSVFDPQLRHQGNSQKHRGKPRS